MGLGDESLASARSYRVSSNHLHEEDVENFPQKSALMVKRQLSRLAYRSQDTLPSVDVLAIERQLECPINCPAHFIIIVDPRRNVSGKSRRIQLGLVVGQEVLRLEHVADCH